MPRYFFNVRDGSDLPDLEGTPLPDLQTARSQAVKLAGSLLAEDKGQFWSGDTWNMEVTDEAGAILFRLEFKAIEKSAARAAFE